MNRRSISLMMLAAMCVSMVATTARAATGKPGQRLKEALAQLDLSTTQKQQIKQIVEQARQQHQSQAGTDATHAHAGKAVLEKIMAVLTPTQKAKLKEILKSERSAKRSA